MRSSLSIIASLLTASIPWLALVACGDGVAEVAATRGMSGTALGGAGVGGGSSIVSPCEAKVYACGDTIDNDADGVSDHEDPDCLGPCDNSEDSYSGGIPGQNESPCRMDCYFDSDSGHGDDNCYWSHTCDPHEVAPDYYPEPDKGSQCAYDPDKTIPGTGASCAELAVTQSQTCLDNCLPLTPNGCDCFGCCELPAGSGSFVWLGSKGAEGDTVCSAADIDDPSVCHPCEPVPSCFNGCDRCEICVGKSGLPSDCGPDGGSPEQCPPELQPCGAPGQKACQADTYCITGCCVVVPK